MGEALVATASLAALPLWPLLWLQGRYVRKHTPRLPGASGPTRGIIPAAGAPLHLLVVGESTVAGVGAPDHARALTGQIASALAHRTERTVHWNAVGKIGATVDVARKRLLPAIPSRPVDCSVLAFGVNDVLQFHTPARWNRDLVQLIHDLRQRVGPAPIVLAAVPPMGHFPALPQPLRWVLGMRATALARSAQRIAPTLPSVGYSATQGSMTAEMFCADRFHPSVEGYRQWGTLIADSMCLLLR